MGVPESNGYSMLLESSLRFFVVENYHSVLLHTSKKSQVLPKVML